MVVVLMGVAGSGKTTVGLVLAGQLGWRFVDADELHSPESVAKMEAGLPLDDADRLPWLERIAQAIDGWLGREEDVVLACSALRARYRGLLQRDPERVRFVWLDGSPELLAERLSHRTGHFLPPSLLANQLATLEPPAEALRVAIDPPPGEIATSIRTGLGLAGAGQGAARPHPA